MRLVQVLVLGFMIQLICLAGFAYAGKFSAETPKGIIIGIFLLCNVALLRNFVMKTPTLKMLAFACFLLSALATVALLALGHSLFEGLTKDTTGILDFRFSLIPMLMALVYYGGQVVLLAGWYRYSKSKDSPQ